LIDFWDPVAFSIYYFLTHVRYLFESDAKREILQKYQFALNKISIFKSSSIKENSKFNKQVLKRYFKFQPNLSNI